MIADVDADADANTSYSYHHRRYSRMKMSGDDTSNVDNIYINHFVSLSSSSFMSKLIPRFQGDFDNYNLK